MSYTAEAYFGEHRGEPAILTSSDDIDRMIDELQASGWEHTVAAVYLRERPLNAAGVPDHELLVAAHPERDVGALFYDGHQDEPASLYSKGSAPRNGSVFF